MALDGNYGKVCEKTINNHSGIARRQRDVWLGVTTQRYHNNRRLIMLEVNCIKFSLDIQNSPGIIMCTFHAFHSKTEGMAAYFLYTPRVTVSSECTFARNRLSLCRML